MGDVIVLKPEQRQINMQLPDFEAPVIMTYLVERTIAEKFDAILQRFELTGRMKAFYDIYHLARTFDFDSAKLQTEITRTLEREERPMTEIVSNGLWHLPKMKICKSGGNIF